MDGDEMRRERRDGVRSNATRRCVLRTVPYRTVFVFVVACVRACVRACVCAFVCLTRLLSLSVCMAAV